MREQVTGNDCAKRGSLSATGRMRTMVESYGPTAFDQRPSREETRESEGS
jgi:hypothetical protein